MCYSKWTVSTEVSYQEEPNGSGVGYIKITNKEIVRTIPLVEESDRKRWIVNLDIDANGQLVGIELLDGKLIPKP